VTEGKVRPGTILDFGFQKEHKFKRLKIPEQNCEIRFRGFRVRLNVLIEHIADAKSIVKCRVFNGYVK